ncbi:MAG: serine/threonine-protein kinase [Planctomycetota bacterium]|nr:serine/threonine-protein kinase [Planctomycetota bacterium]MDA1211529.1 serine/threonine-protein kinase [Planctomycetota bacterium]
MTFHQTDPLKRSEINAELDGLLSEFTTRIQSGEQIAIDDFTSQHPEFANELKRLLPTARALAEMVHTTGSNISEVYLQNTTLGDFRLRREIGRGGMGIVYEAEQISLGRLVALKILPFAGVLDSRQLLRFQNEARAAATLDHPHIVHVHAVGQDRGVHYYAMQMIDGQSLAEFIAVRCAAETVSPRENDIATVTNHHTTEVQNRPSADRTDSRREYFRRVARWGIEAAEGLDYAHQMGIVHRDIKPSNLMINAEGKLWVTDFGLAMTRNNSGLTMTGDVMGTLKYMSPEQVMGQRGIIDQRTDVYSLGMTLYELLALQPGFNAYDRLEIQLAIEHVDPPVGPFRERGVPIELELIIFKAINKSPTLRYATAKAFADDLQRYLADQPIHARQATIRERVAKWSRRHRTLVRSLLGAGVLSLVVTIIAVTVVARARQEAEMERSLHRAEMTIAAAARKHLAEQQYVTRINLADRAIRRGDLIEAESHLDHILELDPSTVAPGFEWNYLKRMCDYRLEKFGQHGSRAYALQVSPDGKLLASAGEKGVRIWDLRTHELVRSIDVHIGDVNGASFSHDSQWLVTCGDDGTARVWNTSTWNSIAILQHSGPAGGGRFTPDGHALYTGERRESLPLDAELPETAILAWPKKRWKVTDDKMSVGDNVVRIWDTQTWTQTATLDGHDAKLQAGDTSDDANWVATGDADGIVNIWQMPQGSVFVRFSHDQQVATHKPGVQYIDFAHNHPWIATAGSHSVHVWRNDASSISRLATELSTIRCVAFSPDDTFLLTSGFESQTYRGSIEIWKLNGNGTYEKTGLIKFPHIVWSLSFIGPDELAGVTDDGVLYRWKLPGLVCARRHVSSVPQSFCHVALSPDGRWQARSGPEVVVQSTVDPRQEIVLDRESFSDSPLVFSSDGEWLFAARMGICRRWSVDGWVPGRSLQFSTPNNRIQKMGIVSPDMFIAEDLDGSLQTWTVDADQIVRAADETSPRQLSVVLPKSNATLVIQVGACSLLKDDQRVWQKLFPQVQAAQVSPDEKWLALANADGSIEIADVVTGEVHALCLGTGVPARSLAFSPDGRTLAGNGQTDGEIRLWNVQTGRELLTLDSGLRLIRSLVFSPNGERVIAAGQNSQDFGEVVEFEGISHD